MKNKNRKGNCKSLVTEYMLPVISSNSEPIDYIKCIKNLNFSHMLKNSKRIFDIKKDLLFILRRKFNDGQC